jgi:hypothetical protein
MTHINLSDPLSGITAKYLGGPSGYSIEFDFQCNEDVPFGEVSFDRVGEERGEAIKVQAHTPEVCPGREWGQIRVGAAFILTVTLFFLGYFVIGTLVLEP